MKYYWCVNCGYTGDFEYFKERNVKCEICEYHDLCELEDGEYREWAKECKHIQDKDIFYITKGEQKSKV